VVEIHKVDDQKGECLREKTSVNVLRVHSQVRGVYNLTIKNSSERIKRKSAWHSHKAEIMVPFFYSQHGKKCTVLRTTT
jgi:hypothetical protein